MVNFEEMLDEAVPYWDWTEDTEKPKLWQNIRVPFKEGARSAISIDGKQAESSLWNETDPNSFLNTPSCPPGDPSVVRRAENVTWNTAYLKDLVRNAFLEEEYTKYNDILINPHNLVHINAGCEMEATATASYDPIFWLNHAYVDRQLAFWEELNKLRGTEIGTFDEMDKKLAPFDNEKYNNVSMTMDNSQSQNVFDYKEKFCYEYDDLTFDGKTPKEFLGMDNDAYFLQNHQPTCPPPPPGMLADCPEVKIKILVGVIMPQYVASNIHTYKICLDKKCVPGYPIVTFGSVRQQNNPKLSAKGVISKKSHSILYSDVTEIVNSQDWDPDKIRAEMTSNLVKGIPQPLVVVRDIKSKTDKVTLGPQQRPKDYGDLLDGYIVN